MKQLLTYLIVMLVVVNLNALSLPDWSRKYATIVVRGHLVQKPVAGKMPPFKMSVSGTALNVNIKNEWHPHFSLDSVTSTFLMRWKTCWPLQLAFGVNDVGLSLPVCPGDTIDIEIDNAKAQELKDDVERLYREAVTIKGATLSLSPRYRAMRKKLFKGTNIIDYEELGKYCRAGFVAYRENEWVKHQQRMKEAKAAKLKKYEKEFLQLELEELYVSKLYNYGWLLNFSKCDSTEIAVAMAQFTAVDPHAASLIFPKSINGAHLFKTGYLEYLEVNGLDNQPLGRYLKERKQAEDVVGLVRAFRPVSADDIDALASEFRLPVYEMKAEIADKMQKGIGWQPAGEPDTWLQQIVARHSGRLVYVDFWATWCGPCGRGIREMATVKEKYEKQGVDFVYITDNSSSTDGFLDLKQKYKGDHFLFPKTDTERMNIPGYAGSIPHYLIYGRDGKLLKTLTGWHSLEAMTKELDEALAK